MVLAVSAVSVAAAEVLVRLLQVETQIYRFRLVEEMAVAAAEDMPVLAAEGQIRLPRSPSVGVVYPVQARRVQLLRRQVQAQNQFFFA